ncbi:hypothetical protein B0H14DRAFT_2617649 [Mycena olivaceomarginata]|nr:hypothetical protein B0H14DRAFT_2617649 [Mycena olivaceomarginata]
MAGERPPNGLALPLSSFYNRGHLPPGADGDWVVHMTEDELKEAGENICGRTQRLDVPVDLIPTNYPAQAEGHPILTGHRDDITYPQPGIIHAFYDQDLCGTRDDFVFVCGGEYYFYDSKRGSVRRYHGTYSPDAFLHARADSFGIAPPESARCEELYARTLESTKTSMVTKFANDGTVACKILSKEGEEQWNIIMGELAAESEKEHKNAPLNDLYTEQFPDPQWV